MNNSKFTIDIIDLYWIDGERDNPDDLCLHGNVTVRIENEIVADNYSCTVSSTALYLLKSIELDHMTGSDIQMLPCCGYFMIPSDMDDTVEISGCPNGIDWSILHQDNYVKLVSEKGSDAYIPLTDYIETVFNFVDKIEEFYKKCQPKNMPTDDFEREGYLKFWKEWNKRRHHRTLKYM